MAEDCSRSYLFLLITTMLVSSVVTTLILYENETFVQKTLGNNNSKLIDPNMMFVLVFKTCFLYKL